MELRINKGREVEGGKYDGILNWKDWEEKHTSVRAVAYASAFSCPDTVRNAGFPKKSCQVRSKADTL